LILDAGKRLGSEALRLLLGHVASPPVGEGIAVAWWRDRQKVAVDGFVLDAPDLIPVAVRGRPDAAGWCSPIYV
jgi:hypothetical protein